MGKKVLLYPRIRYCHWQTRPFFSCFIPDESKFWKLHYFLDGLVCICPYCHLDKYICGPGSNIIVAIRLADYVYFGSLLLDSPWEFVWAYFVLPSFLHWIFGICCWMLRAHSWRPCKAFIQGQPCTPCTWPIIVIGALFLWSNYRHRKCGPSFFSLLQLPTIRTLLQPLS